ADRHALAKLEAGDRPTRLDGQRLLAGDECQLVMCRLDLLRVRDRLADPHVQHDLVESGDLHVVLVTELLLELGTDAIAVLGAQARYVSGTVSHRSSPQTSWRSAPSCHP